MKVYIYKVNHKNNRNIQNEQNYSTLYIFIKISKNLYF